MIKNDTPIFTPEFMKIIDDEFKLAKDRAIKLHHELIEANDLNEFLRDKIARLEKENEEMKFNLAVFKDAYYQVDAVLKEASERVIK